MENEELEYGYKLIEASLARTQETEMIQTLKTAIETVIDELIQLEVDAAEDVLTAITDELMTGDPATTARSRRSWTAFAGALGRLSPSKS